MKSIFTYVKLSGKLFSSIEYIPTAAIHCRFEKLCETKGMNKHAPMHQKLENKLFCSRETIAA